MINIKKSKAPDKVFNHKDKDIKDKIRNDFFVLCYICEEFVPVHFQIDHFKPQNNFPELKNNWENLFYCCGKCNGMRPRNINTDGNEVLNNCIDDVEKLIKLEYIKKTKKIKISSEHNSVKIKNTIKLLNRIYNGIGVKNSKAPYYKRVEIKKEIEKFEKLFEKYKKNKFLFENSIKQRLSKRTKSLNSNYVSFKRQMIDYHKFKQYFD